VFSDLKRLKAFLQPLAQCCCLLWAKYTAENENRGGRHIIAIDSNKKNDYLKIFSSRSLLAIFY